LSDYRQRVRRCPACQTSMREYLADSAHLDCCDECQGVWADWMDGALRNLNLESTVPSPVQSAEAVKGALPSGCPDCERELDPVEFHGAQIYRCGRCVGSFVPRSAIDVWSRGDKATGDPGSSDPLLTRFMDAVSRVLLG